MNYNYVINGLENISSRSSYLNKKIEKKIK